jgi:hypothetical protein
LIPSFLLALLQMPEKDQLINFQKELEILATVRTPQVVYFFGEAALSPPFSFVAI